MPKVSIIVPVYNRASSIRFCLESLYAMHYRDFEVIVVDDGSSDDSPYICQEFCNTHPQFRYIRQDNGGVSNARNHGIREAAGKWITFVDSDDAVCPEHLSVVELEDKNDVDWILESFRIIGTVNDDVQIPSLDVDVFKTRIESNEPVKYVFTSMQKTDTPIFSTCGKFFKLSTCIQHGIRFNERLSLDEDQLFVSTYIQHVRKMVHYPKVRSYINIDRPVVRLSGRLLAPEVYLYGIIENYNAFCKLDESPRCTSMPYAVNYLVYCIVSRILMGYTRPKNRGVISSKKLKKFAEQDICPIFQQISENENLLNTGVYKTVYNLIMKKHNVLALFVCKVYNICRSVKYKLIHYA